VNRAEKDKDAMKRDADDAKASMDSLLRDKVCCPYFLFKDLYIDQLYT